MEQEILKEILQTVKENKQEIKNVETRLQKEINGVKTELQEEIKGVKTELQDEIKYLREEMIGRIDDVVIEMNDEMDRRFTKYTKEIAIEIRSMGEIIYKKIEEGHKNHETRINDLEITTKYLEKKLA